MKVPLSWLREYVDLTVPPAELAARLTLAGIEVESVDEIGAGWEHIYTGRIVNIEPHPDPEVTRLTLVTVDYGRAEPIRVVTGATNIKVGDVVPLALVGARLYSPKTGKVETLKRSKLRGVESEGMICAEDELMLGDDHEGIMLLDPATPVGAALRDVLGDTVLDLEVTPNRSDCLSMLGVAREVGALTGQSVRYPDIALAEGGPPAGDVVRIEIEDPDLCPRYTALVLHDVKIGPSPQWLQDRLTRAGVRPISNIVDVSNYVMLEYGQPLHAFDLDTIAEGTIIVRRARHGERVTTLDGQDRELKTDTLVIADPSGPVALAGVMGGLATEVTDKTRNILLESANFDPIITRRTARHFRLPSEASRRFERGQSPEQTLAAARRAAQLMQQLGGGTVAPGAADAHPKPAAPVTVHLPAGEIPRLLGVPYDQARTAAIFRSLELAPEPADDGGLNVGIPYWRLDLRLRADLVEEYARVGGYEMIPAADIDGAIPPPTPQPARVWEGRAKTILAGAGYSEIITYSLINEPRTRRLVPERLLQAAAERSEGAPAGSDVRLPAVMDYRLIVAGAEPLKVLNPLTEEMSHLRVTTMAQMLETLAANLRHQAVGVQLFELGRIYLPREGDLPDERRVLTIGSGAYRPGRKLGERAETDFFDLKGVLEELLDRMGATGRAWEPIRHASFAPGRAAALSLTRAGAVPARRGAAAEGEIVGVLGEVAREVRDQFGIDEPAWLAYVDFDAVLRYAEERRGLNTLPRFPAILQDVSFVVPEEVTVAAAERTIRGADRRLIRAVDLVDVFRGERLGAGRKSLTFRITYQADDRTLTDADAQKVHQQVERKVQQDLGGELRR